MSNDSSEHREPETKQTRKPRSVLYVIGVLLYTLFVYLVAQLAAGIVILSLYVWSGGSITAAEAWLKESVAAQFFYILLAEIVTVAGVYWFLRRRGGGLRQIGLNKLQLKYVGIAFVGFGAYFLLYIVAATVASSLIPQFNLEQKQDIGFTSVVSNIDLILTAISLVVLPPIAEEILFRGFLFTGLRKKLSLWPTAILTSLAFGAGHLQFGNDAPLLWAAALDTFVLSMVLCYVRERTNSLWPGIFIHAGKNMLAFSALFLFTR